MRCGSVTESVACCLQACNFEALYGKLRPYASTTSRSTLAHSEGELQLLASGAVACNKCSISAGRRRGTCGTRTTTPTRWTDFHAMGKIRKWKGPGRKDPYAQKSPGKSPLYHIAHARSLSSQCLRLGGCAVIKMAVG